MLFSLGSCVFTVFQNAYYGKGSFIKGGSYDNKSYSQT